MENLKRREPRSRDPTRNEEVEIAQQSIGDYKLKIKMDFELKEDLKMSIRSQTEKVVGLEGKLMRLQMVFNQRLQALRDRKLKLRDWIREKKRKIQKIEESLGLDLKSGDLPDIVIHETREFTERAWEQIHPQKSTPFGSFMGHSGCY